MGGYTRSDRRASARTSDRVFDLFPRLARAAEPEGRHPVRRRAADARHRPRADVATRSCCSSTSRRSASRRSSSSRSSRSSARSTRQGTTVLLVEQNALHGAQRRRIAATCCRPASIILADTRGRPGRERPGAPGLPGRDLSRRARTDVRRRATATQDARGDYRPDLRPMLILLVALLVVVLLGWLFLRPLILPGAN